MAVVTDVSSARGNCRRANGRGCAVSHPQTRGPSPFLAPCGSATCTTTGGQDPWWLGAQTTVGRAVTLAHSTCLPTRYNKEEGRWECLETASWRTAENSEMDRTIDSGKGLMTSSAFDLRFQSTAPCGHGRVKVLCLPVGSKAGFHGPCSSSESPLGPKPRTLSTGIKGKPLFQY